MKEAPQRAGKDRYQVLTGMTYVEYLVRERPNAEADSPNFSRADSVEGNVEWSYGMRSQHEFLFCGTDCSAFFFLSSLGVSN